MSTIDELIRDKLSQFDKKEKTLVVDGKYFLYKQKSVYVELVDNKYVEYYIKVKNYETAPQQIFIYGNNEVSKSGTQRENVTAEVSSKLAEIISSDSLGSYEHPHALPVTKCNIIVDGSLDFLIIESPLYNIARQALRFPIVRGLKDNDVEFDSVQIHQLINAFKSMSYDNYNKFMYSKLQRRIINKCYKKKQFYNILHAFIPVAIQYNHIYNPLLDDLSDTYFRESKLIQTAIAKERKVVINENLYCYMLTHEEVCIALGLTRFMRFTPEFLYKLVVGLLHPELPNFPSKTRKIYVHKATADSGQTLKYVYSEQAFEEKLIELADKLSSEDLTEEDKTQIKKDIAILNEYANMDTLFYEIERSKKSLLGIGGNVVMQDNVTTDTLYDILFNAQLLAGV